MNTHRGIVNRLLWMQATVSALNDTDRLLQKTPFSFDVSVLGIFLPLCNRSAAGAGAAWETLRNGGQLCAVDNQGVHQRRCTSCPRCCACLLEEEWLEQCTTLQRVLSSGEELPGGSGSADCFSRLECRTAWNLYGPTEAAGRHVTWWECRAGVEWESADREADLEHASVCAGWQSCGRCRGSGGRVVFGGRGSWARVLAACGVDGGEVSCPTRMAASAAARLYRTGDLVRLVGAEVLEFRWASGLPGEGAWVSHRVGRGGGGAARAGGSAGVRGSGASGRGSAARLVGYVVLEEGAKSCQ